MRFVPEAGGAGVTCTQTLMRVVWAHVTFAGGAVVSDTALIRCSLFPGALRRARSIGGCDDMLGGGV